MGKLFKLAKSNSALRLAWFRIRSNGYQSSLPETREAVKDFEYNADLNLSRIQRDLREKKFQFLPQTGVVKSKSSGGFRGIVMAPVRNRIVERALLDCLQDNVEFIKKVNETPTSVGGVPDRSVPHALAIIREAFSDGKHCFARSDISGFFDGIPRDRVLKTLSSYINDKEFLDILDSATTVTLENEQSLGENRKVFPVDSEGVAQGSPLSPLIGNVLLHDFDKEFNARGIVCVRFIDDFIILGEKEAHVRKAFEKAEEHLKALGLKCHNPFLSAASDKSERGDVSKGANFVFLGYQITQGLYQPSKASRAKLLENVDKLIYKGKKAVREVIGDQNSSQNRQRYVQTFQVLDNVIRGWGNAFSYGNSPSTLRDLDLILDKRIDDFRKWFTKQLSNLDTKAQRRARGICLLEDVERKSLDELPYRLGPNPKYRKSKNIIAVSTDGSLRTPDRAKQSENGNGGWAAVFHDGREFKGTALNTTINRMELTAVIEALKQTGLNARVHVYTDSQYVYKIAERNDIIRKNKDLWDQFAKLRTERRVSISWVKSHAGNPFNEKADKLANAESLAITSKAS